MMEKETSDISGNSSHTVQNTSASILQTSLHVVDQQAQQLQEVTKVKASEAHVSLYLQSSPHKELEVPIGEHLVDMVTVHHSTEQASSICDKEFNGEKSELREENAELQFLDISSMILSSGKDESVNKSVDNQTINYQAVNSSEKMESGLTQSIESPAIPITHSCCEEVSSVIQDGSNTDFQIQLYKRKVNSVAKDQPEFRVTGLCAPVSASNIQSELNSASHATILSDVNTSASEMQFTASDLEHLFVAKTTASAEHAAASSYQESVYYIKWIMFGQINVPVVTQNENGPCPLLAIMNVLLLKEKVKLAPMMEMITSEQLMTYLGECIFENIPQNLSDIARANYEQNMQDAMGVMYKLQTGLDVNVKFTGVGDFEYTPELIIFDLLGISLYHGWLVDPQDSDTVPVINQCSYNQLVEKIITLRQAEEEDNVTIALIAEQFLDRTASQLTYHGLCELSSVIKEKELCVFFRNNHFNTLYKYNNELFLLVTDQGFLTENSVVWETLSNVDGDCHFVDATFRTYTKPAPSSDPIPDPGIPVGSPEQIDHDYQVALFLQEEAATVQNSAWGTRLPPEPMAYADADHELAMRLQEEENWRALGDQRAITAMGTTALEAPSQQQVQGRPVSHGPPGDGQRRRVEHGDHKEKEEKNCAIL